MTSVKATDFPGVASGLTPSASASNSRLRATRHGPSQPSGPHPNLGTQRHGPRATRLTRSDETRAAWSATYLQGAKNLARSLCHQRYRVLIRPAVKVVAKVHLGLLRASRGNLGCHLFGAKVVLLTTVGRRSGRQRTTPLVYLRRGDGLVVAASCGGSDRAPDWWLNLQRQPVAVMEVSGVKSVVRAYEVEHSMLGELTSEFEQSFPQMAFYRKVSGRQIPLIVLQPAPRGVSCPAVRIAS